MVHLFKELPEVTGDGTASYFWVGREMQQMQKQQ